VRQISLREFRTRSLKALGPIKQGEIVLMSGEEGLAYFLVPVLGDVVMVHYELWRAMAKVSLRENWFHAKASGLDQMNEQAIHQEVKRARGVPKRRTAK